MYSEYEYAAGGAYAMLQLLAPLACAAHIHSCKSPPHRGRPVMNLCFAQERRVASVWEVPKFSWTWRQ